MDGRLLNEFERLAQRITDAVSLDQLASVLELLLMRGYDVWADGNLYESRQLASRIKGRENGHQRAR
jgi:hypothetical protein